MAALIPDEIKVDLARYIWDQIVEGILIRLHRTQTQPEMVATGHYPGLNSSKKFLPIKTQPATFGTSAATYKLIESN